MVFVSSYHVRRKNKHHNSFGYHGLLSQQFTLHPCFPLTLKEKVSLKLKNGEERVKQFNNAKKLFFSSSHGVFYQHTENLHLENLEVHSFCCESTQDPSHKSNVCSHACTNMYTNAHTCSHMNMPRGSGYHSFQGSFISAFENTTFQ